MVQLILEKVSSANIVEVAALGSTARAMSGFGSTGLGFLDRDRTLPEPSVSCPAVDSEAGDDERDAASVISLSGTGGFRPLEVTMCGGSEVVDAEVGSLNAFWPKTLAEVAAGNACEADRTQLIRVCFSVVKKWFPTQDGRKT